MLEPITVDENLIVEDIGAIIKNVRLYLDMSEEDLSNACNVTVATISAIENGKRNPSIKTLTRICNGLGMPIEDIMCYRNEESRARVPVIQAKLKAYPKIYLENEYSRVPKKVKKNEL